MRGLRCEPQTRDQTDGGPDGPWGAGSRRGGPRRRYGPEEARVLKDIWFAAEQPCGKRLAAALPLWLPHYEARKGRLDGGLRDRLLGMSPSSIDRLLAPHRAAAGRRARCGTRPGTLLRSQIPVLVEHRDIQAPGWIEADSVAHCGDSTAGDHVWSLTFTDVLSQWTENRACFNKGGHAVCERVAAVEADLPFPILGFDCDNGSEFLNHHLVAYFHRRERKVAFTRSRPYRKNDNARVEQKNWTHVRQLVGYCRLGDPRQAELLDALYREIWNPWRNFFCPAMRLVEKRREGSRLLRRYDRPQTPFDRLKASGTVEPHKIATLQRQMDALDPFEMKRQIEARLRAILRWTPAHQNRMAA
ncbi:MAG TPA: hypothetical protein PLU30_06525 [Verrucomicrobiae bacterium]|nr:hypothetical protein [Verrucomicrobiae bacterium]